MMLSMLLLADAYVAVSLFLIALQIGLCLLFLRFSHHLEFAFVPRSLCFIFSAFHDCYAAPLLVFSTTCTDMTNHNLTALHRILFLNLDSLLFTRGKSRT